MLCGSLLMRGFCLKYRRELVWPQYLALPVQKLFPALSSEHVEALLFDMTTLHVSSPFHYLKIRIMVTQMTLISPNKSYYYHYRIHTHSITLSASPRHDSLWAWRFCSNNINSLSHKIVDSCIKECKAAQGVNLSTYGEIFGHLTFII
jgi:hypothetical protein